MKTLNYKIQIKGAGLMSNMPVELEIHPSDKKGIRFHIGSDIIHADVNNVVSTQHCVVLGNPQNLAAAKVMLVEHFMAAAAVCNLDALDVHFKNPDFNLAASMQNTFEMPVLDGSSKKWVEAFENAGYAGEQDAVPALREPVFIQKGKSHVIILPSGDETKITYSVDYEHPDLKGRFVTLNLKENLDDIIEARTFGYLKDLKNLQDAGFSKGVTIENTLGLTEDGYTTILKSDLEPVKHKILDIIGDLYLTGANPLKLKANIIVKEAGHALHIEAAKKLAQMIGEKND